jgi:hypothetical protein
MGVVNVKPEWSTIEAPIDLSSGSSPKLSWTVLLDGRDSYLQAPVVARQAPGIPRVGQRHPADPTAVCRTVEPKAISPHYFRVTASYYTPSGGTNEQGETVNPLDLPPEVSYGYESIMQMVDVDLDDKAIVNAAGEPFDPLPEVTVYLPVLRVTRNETAFPANIARDYGGGRGAVNSDSFRGWPKGTALCRPITGADQRAGEIIYCRVAYEIVFDSNGWQPRPLNMGYRELVGGKLVVIKDKDGQAVSQPVALNANGTAKAPGAAVDRAGPFKVHPELPFNVLGL